MVQISIANLIQIVFACQCLFGALLLGGKPSFRFLVWLLVGNAVLMTCNILEETGVTNHFYLISPIFSLLWGPLMLLFVSSLMDDAQQFPVWTHFVVPLLALPFTNAVQAVLLFGALSQILYAGWIARMLFRYRRATQDMRSDAADLSLTWLTHALLGMGVLAVIDVLRHTLQPYLPLHVLQLWYVAMLSAHLLLLSYWVLKAAKEPERFVSLRHYRIIVDKGLASPQPNAHSVALFDFIERHIEQTRLYRKERLSLRELAEATGLQERDISRAINTAGQVNFNDFINGYRIEEVKARLRAGGGESILEIALAAGFSSKSSFNMTFKRMTGMTPSQYMVSLQAIPPIQSRAETSGAVT